MLAGGEFRNADSGRLEGILRIVRISDGRLEREWPLPDRGMCIAVSEDGKRIAVGVGLGSRLFVEEGAPPEVRVWDVANDQELPSLKGHTSPIQQLQFERDGKVSVRSLAFSRDGNTLYSGMDRGDLLVWDVSRAYVR